ncbi:WEB family protein At5g16730, chloroplastic-like isoform X1 [Rhodamnia argentea]|uniref:WEB family protein At5g16730, chloroplastic-like isoform X1 n=1 Tax=Rhodamnia argentea TaxID=178133 RepID=A0A8B8PFH2_9MYRT|nr:WEB family protein At5g16730, chloroplastic-like isoform X1 [Rhodamnia argentea]
MSSKSKSTSSETPNSKASPATPRVSKLGRGLTKAEPDASAPSPNPRLSVDRSPRSVASRPTVDRRSPKLTTPPDKPFFCMYFQKPVSRALKSSDLQTQLNLAQDELKKAKEHVALIEKEKAKALEELKETQKAAEDANEKLRDAMVAQKRAEESSEIEKFRAIELEQSGIEAAQKKEEEWERELEAVRSQHALDVAALLSTSQELQRIQHELAMACDAKNQALNHADDATKIAEIHAEKVQILSAELTRLKTLLDSKLETEASENNKMVSQLKVEIGSLREELEKAKGFEEKLAEREASIEQLNVELEAAKMAESYAHSLVEEWKNKVQDLEISVEEANKLEKSASESLTSVMKQLERSNDLLHDAESEVAALKEKVGLLELTTGKQTGDLQASEHRLDEVKEENLEMGKMIESLRTELNTVREEKTRAVNNEKLAASDVKSLLEEKTKLVSDLKISKEEEEKSKKAMESLASALHEVSAEARDTKEKLVCIQIEHENCESQMEDLELVLKATNEKCETMLDDAKHEMDILAAAVEQSKNEYENSKAEWEQKELHLVDCVKQSEEEKNGLQKERERLLNLLKQAEENAGAANQEEALLKDSLNKAEAEVTYLQEALGGAKAESMKFKESLLDKENELQGILQENEELRTREAASLAKADELSKLLEEARVKLHSEENGELSDTEKDYDLLPKVVEFSEENGHGREEKHMVETPPKDEESRVENFPEQNNVSEDVSDPMVVAKSECMNGKTEDESKGKEEKSVEVEYKMWESCKIEKKEFSPEREPEQESVEEEADLKADGGGSCDQINGTNSSENINDGGSSPSKQQNPKKKKPLLRKFGSLLKKKGASNPK